MIPRPCRAIAALLIGAIVGLSGIARGQIFVENSNGAVGEYTMSGAPISSSLFYVPTHNSVYNTPSGIAAFGFDILTASWYAGTAPPSIGGPFHAGKVSEYDASGNPTSDPFAASYSSKGYPSGLALSDSNLFVSLDIFTNGDAYTDGEIYEYSTSSGSAVGNPSNPIITGLDHPTSLAISGSDLFVVNNGSGTVGEYTTLGAAISTSLISGLTSPNGIAIYGSNLFVTNGNAVSEYDISVKPPTLVSSSITPGLSTPWGLAIYGSNLLITNNGNNTLGDYSLTNSTYSTLISSGLTGPTSIAILPEPASFALAVLAATAILPRRRRV
jgi:hypothetical protein